jgi:PQQ-like domain/Abnormal spindle-like microcephaly-assoc'd, ASPM-SPD-2-Hydin
VHRIRAVLVLCGLLLLTATAQALGAEVTNSGENLRTGWYPGESSISPGLVTGGTFGQLWSAKVEGQVYAQPLLANGSLFVATENNDIYSLNPATGAQNWQQSLTGAPFNPGEISCADLAPQIGVTATPVIDEATNTAYLTHKSYVSGSSGPSRWEMDAIDLANGEEQAGFPVEIGGSAQNVFDGKAQKFNAATELQRPGLLLMNGVVYAAFGSDCDTSPWQGWVFGVSTEGGANAVRARWVADESGEGAGIWQSGAGLTSDRPGSILLSTGNGGAPEHPTPGEPPPPDLGESVVRLNVQPDGSLKAVDFFAPFDAPSLDAGDADFASGGVTGLPEEYFGTPTVPHLAVAVGKDGYVYLLNRDHLGGIGQGPSGSDDVVQRIGPNGGVWSRPGVWPGEGGWVYIPTASAGTSASGSSGNLYMYKYGLSPQGVPQLAKQGVSSEEFGFSSSAPVITSDGTIPGSALVWIVWAPNGSGVGAQLRAYNPVPVGGKPELVWSRPIGTSAKFALPGVGAGRLYVGTRDGHVIAFGSPVTPLLSGPPTAFPATTVGGESAHATLTLTATSNVTITKLASSSSQFILGTPTPALPADLSSTGDKIEIPITFTPTATGPLGATVTVTLSNGSTVQFSLSGSGQAATALLEIAPPVVTLGGTSVGEVLEGAVTLKNVGAESLTIESVNAPSPPFGTSGVSAAGQGIKPGGELIVNVTFAPIAVGSFVGQIEFDTSGGDDAVALTGSAGLPGTLSITSETNEYGPVAIGSSAKKSFTITNTGGTSVPITLSKPPTGGEFAAASSLPLPEGETTVKPGQSITETVVFTPTVAGEASAVWKIAGEDTTGQHDVTFHGVGVAPAAELSSQLLAGLGILATQQSAPPHRPDAELSAVALTASTAGTVSVIVRCPAGTVRCDGTVTLRTLNALAAGGHRPAIVTLARGSFSAVAGGARRVKLRLTREGRELLARKHLLRARATIVAHDPSGTTGTTHTVVVIRAARHTHGRRVP